MRSKRVFRTLFAALIILLAICFPASMEIGIFVGESPEAFAQSQQQAPAAPARQLLSVRITRIKPEMATEYRDLIKNEYLPAYKKAGVKERSTWVTALFGNSFEYVSVMPIESMKQFDESGPMIKALGEEGSRALNARWSRMVTDSRMFVIQTRPDLSIAPKTPEEPKLAVVYTQRVAMGRVAEYENHFKTVMLPQFSKANQKAFLVSRVMFGGDNMEYLGMFMLDSYAHLNDWLASTAKAGVGQGNDKLAGIVLHQENAIYRYVPELSIAPAAQKAEAK